MQYILTGGMAYQEEYVNSIRSMVSFIAEVVVYPGEDELKALAFNGLLALDGKIEIKISIKITECHAMA